MKKLLCVLGPTASGKTALAISLALRFGGEIVSCDSMQVYRGMDIGTAKPTEEERRGVPHHMLDVADPDEHYSCGRYVREAARVIEGIYAAGGLPILCGGTGFYHKALTQGLADIPDCPALEHGPDAWRMLCEADPETSARLSPNDSVRIGRALDVWRATGIPLSEFHRRSRREAVYDTVCLGLSFEDRRVLYGRIDARVDRMLAGGLEDETRVLLERYGDCASTAMQAIGYKEMAGYLNGEASLCEAAGEIKRASRRYAKRQLTWFAKTPNMHWFDGTDKNIFDICANFVEKQQ